MQCPNDSEVLGFLAADGSGKERARVERHIDRCASCQELVGLLGATSLLGDEPLAEPASVLERGDRVGRYLVLSRIGAGGMGIVYAAHDPELDRKVALKVLLPGTGDDEGQVRLLREAQALARLQHPNVVTVHDVGTHDARVWLAMEFVEGKTLGAWLRTSHPGWPAVLDALVQAGLGIVAAHRAGLLHRDLKPDNIMVGDDGRVRVMDFGLARPGRPEKEAPAEALAGTPAYMAPEQRAGAEIGAASDQFSLCVTLWEALYGERPFAGPAPLMDAGGRGALTPPPRRGGPPTWLRRVVERGLSARPEARWPSVDALLEALGRGRARARLRRGLIAAGLAGLLVAGVAGWYELEERRAVAACEAAGASIDELWNDETRDKVRAALLATGVSYAQASADRVTPWIDAHAAAWAGARSATCIDAEVHNTRSTDLAERGLWCLDERRMELEALLVELVRADAYVAQHAVTAVADLSPVEVCRDRNLLGRLPPPPTERREEVRAARAELSRAAALERTGKYEEGVQLTLALLPRAEALGWPPLSAAVRATAAGLLERTGAYEESLRLGAEAYFEAARAGAWDQAARAAMTLAPVAGARLARPAEGIAWGHHAEVALAHSGDVADLREASRLNNVAVVHRFAGEHEQARALQERALAIQIEALGPDHPRIAGVLNNLAIIHRGRGELAEARSLYERALAIREAALGADHPEVATTLNNLAVAHHVTGGHEQAKALLSRAIAIAEAALGLDHPDVASSLVNLANVTRATGDLAEARSLFERALASQERRLGPDHPEVATTLNNLAGVHVDEGDYERAGSLLARALAAREEALGPDHPLVGTSLHNLGELRRARGEHAAALPLLERALAIREEALGADHLDVASSLRGLAEVHRTAGDKGRSLALLERAVSIYGRHEGTQPRELDTRFALAEALAATGERARAVRLAEQVRDGYHAAGPDRAKDLAEVEAWLARYQPDRGRD